MQTSNLTFVSIEAPALKMPERQPLTRSNPPRRAMTIPAAILCCFVCLWPFLGHSQNIYADPWQSAPWQTVSYQPNMQYRWIGGGMGGTATIWAGCKVQLRTTDGSQVKVDLNIFFEDADGPDWMHFTEVIVNGGGGYTTHAFSLNNISNSNGMNGCTRVDRVEVNEDAPAE
jgi:hypothetical protein